MKLLLCENCGDIINLKRSHIKSCFCGKSGGGYTNNKDIEYFGDNCYILGFDNLSLLEAISYSKQHPDNKLGEHFTAFVIPKNDKTLKKIDKINP